MSNYGYTPIPMLGMETQGMANQMGNSMSSMFAQQYGGMNGGQVPASGPGLFGSLFGSTNAQTGGWNPGMAGSIMGTVQGLGNLYMGMKQYGLMKDQFSENKKQFAMNFDSQKKLTNSRLEDRQAARVASNPTAYESVSSYMDKNRIGG